MTERPILFSASMVRALLAGTKTQTRRVVRGGEQHEHICKNSEEDTAGREFFVCCGPEEQPPAPASTASPIVRALMSGPMRRITGAIACPYGQPGDRLWVRETWAVSHAIDHLKPREVPQGAGMVYYPATEDTGGLMKRPSIFMPRWASRITLEITGVRVERLQDISEADARAEGISELVPARKRLEGLTPAAMAFAAAAVVQEMPRSTRRGFLQGALAAALGFKASASRPWEVQPGRIERAPTAQQLYAVLWESINGPGSWAANPWVWVVEFRRVSS